MSQPEAGSPGQAAYTHDYYGVPDWLMKEYLTDLGAVEVEENVVATNGWRAVIRKAAPRHIKSLVVGGATVDFSGNEAALQEMFKKLHWKTLRGGG